MKVQEAHNAEWEEGLSYKFIWKKFIYNTFFIEYHTYINYLGINARKQLKEIEEEITADRQKEEAMKGVTPLFGLITGLVICLTSACGVPAAKLASKCAEQFPCKDSLVVRQVTKTDTLEITDTYIEYDTIDCPPSKDGVTLIDVDTVYIKGKKIVITRTVTDSTFWRIDQAQMASLAQEIEGLQQQRDNLTAKLAACQTVAGEASSGLPWWWLLIVSAGGFLVAKFFNKKPKT